MTARAIIIEQKLKRIPFLLTSIWRLAREVVREAREVVTLCNPTYQYPVYVSESDEFPF